MAGGPGQFSSHFAFPPPPAFPQGAFRELYFEPQVSSSTGNYRTRNIGGSGNFNFNFFAPSDFTLATLIALELIGSPEAGAAGAGRSIDWTSSYGAPGESITTHGSLVLNLFNLTGTADTWVAFDLVLAFPALGPLDVCGINVDHNGIGGAIRYHGIRLRYRVP